MPEQTVSRIQVYYGLVPLCLWNFVRSTRGNEMGIYFAKNFEPEEKKMNV